MDELSAGQARRIALAAQGFADRRPGAAGARIDRRHFRRVLGRLGAVQIDTVNVLVRAHEMTFFARLGPYDRTALANWLHRSSEVFEYWGHEASFLPVETQPALRWRMDEAKRGATWGGIVRFMREHPDYLNDVLRTVKQRGPVVPADLHDGVAIRRTGPWWCWDAPKRALEALFWCGEVAAVRGNRFERIYDVPERVLPAEVVSTPTPTEEDGRRELVRQAARAIGVGTARDLADYYRQRTPKAGPVVEAMAADGELVPVRVEGWKQPAYLHADARLPRRIGARTLLAPFDSLVWERARVERLFGFHYRIEIYVPPPRRVFGYYVLPFLLGDRLVARVDLKADRKAGVLRVRAAWTEPEVDGGQVAAELAAELELLAGWLALDDISVEERGDLARPLRHALRTRSGS